jgi:cbb3-type cytochrome oxidase subunit 3
MTLTDIMSGSGLAVYAEIALVMFVSIFAIVLGSVSRRRNPEAWQQAKNLPLDEEGNDHASAAKR